MAKPIITGSSMVLDATKEYTFSFTYSGAIVYKHQLYITEKTSGGVVYDKTIESRILQCTIPENTLKNGNTYYVQVAAIDSQGNSSGLSNKVYALCHETPTLSLDITDSQKIDTSSIEATVTFSQPSGTDNFKLCQFYLYSDNGTTILSQSDKIYPSTKAQSYKFNGLSDDTTYYIRCTGQSVAGFSLDTGLIRFYVMQAHTKVFSNFYVKNQNGGIHYESNLIVINPKENVPRKNSKVYLIDSTKYPKLTYDSGFTIPEDFSLLWNGCFGDEYGAIAWNAMSIGDYIILYNDDFELHVRVEQRGLPNDNENDRYIYSYVKINNEDNIVFSNQWIYIEGHSPLMQNDLIMKIFLKHYNGLWSLHMQCSCSCGEGEVISCS